MLLIQEKKESCQHPYQEKLYRFIKGKFNNKFPSFSLSIKDDTILMELLVEEIFKFNQMKVTKIKEEIVSYFGNTRSCWTFNISPANKQIINLKVIFLFSNRFASFQQNPVLQNMPVSFEKILKDFSNENFFTRLNFLEDGSFSIKSSFKGNQTESIIKKTIQRIKQVFQTIFFMNNPGKYEIFSNQEDMIYSRKPLLSKAEIDTTFCEKTKFKSSKKNIMVLDDVKEGQEEKDIEKSQRVSIKLIFISGKFLKSENLDQVEEEFSKKRCFMREEKGFLKKNQKSFLEHQLETLKELKNELSYEFIGDFFYERNKISKKRIFSEPYWRQLGNFSQYQHKSFLFNQWFRSLFIYINQLLSVLNYFYQHDWIHADIKPQNIMVSKKEKKIKVIDIGGIKKWSQIGENESQRQNFSTQNYYYHYYQKQNQQKEKKAFWNHPKFDMFGFGKIVENTFPMERILEKFQESLFQKYCLLLEEIKKQCMKNPNEIQITYQDIIKSINKC